MRAISFRFLIALLEVVKRLWFTRGEQLRCLREGQSVPPQGGKPYHRHSAFLEFP